MNPQIKERWVKALRNNNYKQGKERLCSETNGEKQYCCLGVLLDVIKDDEGVNLKVESYYSELNESTCYFFGKDDENFDIDKSSGVLPRSILPYCGLDEMLPKVLDGDGEVKTLSALNDDGETFETISNLIEEQL